MSDAPTWGQREFLKRMQQSAENAQWGFEILLKREDFANFFGFLQGFDLLSPANDPAPVEVEDGKYVQIPYWHALDYLEACAKLAGQNNDHTLAGKVLGVLRNVTKARQVDHEQPDNHHTSRKFAEILGLLPTAAITRDDLDLIPTWLVSRFDHGMVGNALDLGLMKHLLESADADDWSKANQVLRHCTEVIWEEEEGLETSWKKPVSVMKDYWLKELIEHHAAALGAKTQRETVEIFLGRLREVYGSGDRSTSSQSYRPAIEDHAQNYDWAGTDNRFVEGTCAALLAWLDVDLVSATSYVDELLNDDAEIVRRIALHILNQRWGSLRGLLSAHIQPELFDEGHLHELYGLMRDRFISFTDEEKSATVEAIRNIRPSDHWKNSTRSLKRVQRNWLSAISGRGFQAADTWYSELGLDESLGRHSDHPDFHSYLESWSGPGPSPFSLDQLIRFAKEGSLVRQLNSFKPENSWRGPTTRALVDALEETVAAEPEILIATLAEFSQAQRPYQYGIISGFKNLWDAPTDKLASIDWDSAWPALIAFFEKLIGDEMFWAEPVVEHRDLTPTRDWIPSLISEFLRAGTRNDERVYGDDLLQSGWQLIKILLEKSELATDVSDDPMTQAINSEKGKAIEALFSHALRICRLGDRIRSGDHTDEWAVIRPVFDAELKQCQDSNFEFSTLVGAYLANIEYMNGDWLSSNVAQIFPASFPKNLVSAVAGLAYAPATHSAFRLLAEQGILDRALTAGIGRPSARERLVERISLAYLWGDEELSSSRFAHFFGEEEASDLQIVSNFLWSISNQDLEDDQVQKILVFWKKCIEWSKTLAKPPARLLSSLSRLSVYLTEIKDEEAGWLEYVAVYVHIGYNADEFIEQLLRLVEIHPHAVNAAFARVLETYKPTIDFQDKLKSLIRKLADKGLRTEAIAAADKLNRLPGMQELFLELVP